MLELAYGAGHSPQDYVMTIGGVTTAPTKGTVVHDKATFTRIGSLLLVQYAYEQLAAGTEGHAKHRPIVPRENPEGPSGFAVPQTHGIVRGS